MILDEHMEVLDWVEKDIRSINLKDANSQKGMLIESVLRCAILKQHRQLSYEELSFTLLDSLSCQTFARLIDGFVSGIVLTHQYLQGTILRPPGDLVWG